MRHRHMSTSHHMLAKFEIEAFVHQEKLLLYKNQNCRIFRKIQKIKVKN